MHAKAQPSIAAKIVGVVALVTFILICVKATLDMWNDYKTDPATSGGQSQWSR